MNKGAYIPGLDGVRALAIAAVIGFHAEMAGLAPGGFLGVDVFFVLSGFLITSLLLRERLATGGLRLGAFYAGRLRRLLPAMLAMVVGSTLAALWWAPDALHRQQQDVPAALVYLSNWWQIHSGQSYFEMFGRPPLLQHLWSLAIEEQFYVVWPLLLLAGVRLGGRWGVLGVAAGLAVASTGWMAWLAIGQGVPEYTRPDRLYLGSDTHAMGLLMGAALACVWNPWRRPRPSAAPAHPWHWELLGWVGLAGVLAAFALVSEADAALYRGGFAVVSLATCLLMLGATDERTALSGVLGLPLLRYIGQRSYGLYLWHWPVFVLLRPGHELPPDPWLALGVRLCVTLVLTELSYRWVEQPVRSYPAQPWRGWGWLGFGLVCAVGGVALAQLYRVQAPALPPLLGEVAATQADADGAGRAVGLAGWAHELRLTPGATPTPATPTAPTAPTVPATTPAASGDGWPDGQAVIAAQAAGAGAAAPAAAPADSLPTPLSPPATAAPAAIAPATPAPPVAPATPVPRESVVLTAVGDSVLLGTQAHLTRTLSPIVVDAKAGRQGSEGLERLQQLRSADRLADVVLVHLGTNGYLYESSLRAMLKELSDRRLVMVVSVHAPRRWIDDNNRLLRRVIPLYPNARLLDWREQAVLHPEYLGADGVHLTGRGMHAYASLIRGVLTPGAPAPAPDTALARRSPASPTPAVKAPAMPEPEASTGHQAAAPALPESAAPAHPPPHDGEVGAGVAKPAPPPSPAPVPTAPATPVAASTAPQPSPAAEVAVPAQGSARTAPPPAAAPSSL